MQPFGAHLKQPLWLSEAAPVMLAKIDQLDPPSTMAALDVASSTCPPCAVAMMRAARLSAGPK